MMRPKPLLQLALTLNVIHLPSGSASYECDGSVAQPAGPYISAYPPGATTVSHPPSGPTGTSLPPPPPTTTGGFDWGSAVDDVAFRHKDRARRGEQRMAGRDIDDDETFECAYFETCLLDGGGVDSSGDVIDGGRLLCYQPYNGEADYKDGYTVSFASGKYRTSDDDEGNLVTGPCPGDIYEESPSGGCQRAEGVGGEGRDDDEDDEMPSSSTSVTASPTTSTSVSGSAKSSTSRSSAAAETSPASLNGADQVGRASAHIYGVLSFVVGCMVVTL